MRKRRIMRKLHNGVLWIITGIMTMVFLVSLASADSESYFFVITTVISLAWIYAFAKVNEERWN